MSRIAAPASSPTNPPPEAWEPARQAAKTLMRPLERFLHIEAASGVLLLIAAVIAMVWANSPWAESYEHLWHASLGISVGSWDFTRPLHFWINDALMVIFFFVVGLEIRREMHGGELSDIRRASLPVAAAVGGMVVPALFYWALNPSGAARQGWGVPMATDIAFAVGILALLGKRVPAALRVLLLALAIIDDIGAILVIALFYSSGIVLSGLVVVLVGVALVLLMQRLGVRSALAYIVPGVVIWAGMYQAGIHPTIAGVILGLLTPARAWFGRAGFVSTARDAIDEFERSAQKPEYQIHSLIDPLRKVDEARREAIAPVSRLEAALHPWVAYGIMPIFALANAGVPVGSVDLGSGEASMIVLGVALGLALGKPIGIAGASLLTAKLGLCVLPKRVGFKGLLVVGCVGGIGFTMALFVAQLAFQDAAHLSVAKLAVLIGSLVAGLAGLLLGVILLPRPVAGVAGISVDQAERSTEE